MKFSIFNFQFSKTLFAIIIVLSAALMRLVPHPANVAPIAAMGLFGGVYLDKKYALLLPILAMVVSDFFLGFHPAMPLVYASFFLTGLIGMALKRKKTVSTVFLAAITSSVLFFFITNLNFLHPHQLYPQTIAGQLTSYQMALPFLKNTLVGDLMYAGLFFGGYELLLLVTKRKAVAKS